jgi:hypothetical protein
MTTLYPYDKNTSEWLNNINENNIDTTIDYFFTQRKVTEYEEIIEEKTLLRKKKKYNRIYNFLAINFPILQFKNVPNLTIDIEIWGDEKFNFKGSIKKEDGDIPHLMLKLKDDKIIFVKLIFHDNDKNTKTFINFIQVNKRYQIVPDTILDVDENNT